MLTTDTELDTTKLSSQCSICQNRDKTREVKRNITDGEESSLEMITNALLPIKNHVMLKAHAPGANPLLSVILATPLWIQRIFQHQSLNVTRLLKLKRNLRSKSRKLKDMLIKDQDTIRNSGRKMKTHALLPIKNHVMLKVHAPGAHHMLSVILATPLRMQRVFQHQFLTVTRFLQLKSQLRRVGFCYSISNVLPKTECC